MNKLGVSCCAKWSRGREIANHFFHTKIYADGKEQSTLFPGLTFSSKYDRQTTDQILDALNKMNVDDHTRYDVSKNRLQKIERYRKTNGPFETIDQVLRVDDFGVKILEKFVASIVAGPKDEKADTLYKPSLKDLSVVAPLISEKKRSAIDTVTSIYIGPKHVSWAKMESNGRLVLWDSHSDFELPKKDNPVVLHDLALKLRRILPVADAYVTEAVSLPSGTMHNQSPGGAFSSLQRIQLSATLVTLLATRFDPPTDGKQGSWTSNENSFYIRQQIVPKLFDLMIGYESVSPRTVINRIIDASSRSIECVAPITIGNYEVDVYRRSDEVKKDALSQALLMAAAFLNLAVIRNPDTYKALNRRWH